MEAAVTGSDEQRHLGEDDLSPLSAGHVSREEETRKAEKGPLISEAIPPESGTAASGSVAMQIWNYFSITEPYTDKIKGLFRPFQLSPKETLLTTSLRILQHNVEEPNTPLFSANLEPVHLLVAERYRAYCAESNRKACWRAVHLQTDAEAVSELLPAVEDPAHQRNHIYKGKGQESLLHVAASRNFSDAAEVLIRHGYDPDLQNSRLETPLHVAAARGSTRALKLLLVKQAQPTVLDKDRCTPLHHACAQGHEEAAKMLLDRFSASVDTQNRKVSYLCSLAQRGETPVHIAAARGLVGILQLLVARHCNLEITTELGLTACHLACEAGQVSALQTLIASGANLRVKDKTGSSSLHLAASRLQNAAVIRAIVTNGGNVDVQDKVGRTPLYIAIFCGCDENAVALLELKANPTLRAKDGRDPLSLAESVRPSMKPILESYCNKISGL